jgi:plasmid stability protein
MVLFQILSLQEGKMPVNLSIKHVPEYIAEQLRRRATRHHRSLQGELLAILEENLASEVSLTPEELLAEVRKFDLKTRGESTKIIRQDRNARSSR